MRVVAIAVLLFLTLPIASALAPPDVQPHVRQWRGMVRWVADFGMVELTVQTVEAPGKAVAEWEVALPGHRPFQYGQPCVFAGDAARGWSGFCGDVLHNVPGSMTPLGDGTYVFAAGVPGGYQFHATVAPDVTWV